MNKNFYEILGVDKNASDKDIKKAYRKLSKMYHPDLQSGKSDAEKKEAEDKMKEINAAYETLSDPEKRQRYDNPQPGFGGFGDWGPSGGDPFDDFADFFGGRGHSKPKKPQGSDIQMRIPITIDEIIHGCTKKVRYKRKKRCTECHGAGGTGKTVCPYCHGSGFLRKTIQTGPNSIFTQQTVCPHCHGKGYKFEHSCSKCGGTGFEEVEEIIELHFEPGVIEGNAQRMMGKGNESSDPDGFDGSFYAIPVYKFNSEIYNLDNFPHIVRKVKLNWVDALLGGKIEIDLEGRGKRNVTIPECTKPGDLIKLSGLGVSIVQNNELGWMNGNKITGDYILSIEYSMPKNLSEKQKKLLKDLKETF